MRKYLILLVRKRDSNQRPAIMYLWRRKFGSSEYPSGFFVRYFDEKIAMLINYREARAKIADLTRLADELHRINGRCQGGGTICRIIEALS
jgi:hypothetical protein